ncbi:enoyl-CoA hydratase [Mesorhizobium sp. YM1C-6-2]|jgi:enoyl-CoA hydratase/carnithine racemase|uniref:enoyl-CoA hydratase n=1 Tax=Mesorhizobium sp. YM1C-6-2 TaxID=1827501 RepID=UPI000EF1879C|nr:enoyl-CoA hydratase [Mesorhizobium sp. YM1C-6-2]RLP22619.1 enoyl-CoA hydratase [Mesorhizobium sp. YM1C-6-2]
MADVVSLRRETGEREAGEPGASPDRGILRITLNNPPANLLSIEVMRDMQAELDRARDDDAVRVVVIAAAGKLFCAGHDLKQMTAHRTDPDGGKAFFEETFAVCSKLMQSIVSHPKPVIAEIDGIATAAGCQLVASCDLAIASDHSSFGVNGINVGLFCTTPGVALVRGLKPKHAMEMLLTGEMVDAATAKDFGLVNRVVPREYLSQIVSKYAETIISKPPLTVKLGKEAFYRQAEMGLADAYDYASRVMVENLLGGEAKEGICAFIEKRKPEWKAE